MFRDAKEELQRLEQELLQEEPDRNQTREDMEPEFGEEPSGEYVGSYVNYANGYRAYNSDTTDVDLEEFSEEVYRPAKNNLGVLLAVLMLLLTGMVCLLLWWFLRWKGIIG